MKRKLKYQKKHQKSRDCTKCKRYDGFISKNYFVCKYDEDIKDILDRDVLKKGTCNLFVPKEIDQLEIYHDLYDHTTMEWNLKEDDQDLPDEE